MREESHDDEHYSDISEVSGSYHTMSERTYDCEEEGSVISEASETTGSSITSEENYDYAAQDSDISDDSTHCEMSRGDIIEDECIEETGRQRSVVWTIVITITFFTILIEAAIGIMFLIDPDAASAALTLIANGFRKGT